MPSENGPTTAQPPDPEPASTPGLAPGGGAAPGETPPASGQETQSSNADPVPRAGISPMVSAWTVVVAVFVVIFLATAVLLTLKIFGVFD